MLTCFNEELPSQIMSFLSISSNLLTVLSVEFQTPTATHRLFRTPRLLLSPTYPEITRRSTYSLSH